MSQALEMSITGITPRRLEEEYIRQPRFGLDESDFWDARDEFYRQRELEAWHASPEGRAACEDYARELKEDMSREEEARRRREEPTANEMLEDWRTWWDDWTWEARFEIGQALSAGEFEELAGDLHHLTGAEHTQALEWLETMASELIEALDLEGDDEEDER